MNISNLISSFCTGMLGVGAGLMLSGHRVDDTVTAKTIRVVDKDDNAIVLLNEDGITLKTPDSTGSMALRPGDLPQIQFARGGFQTLLMGAIDGTNDGMMTFHHGARRIVLRSGEGFAKVSVGLVPEDAPLEGNLLATTEGKLNAAGLTATDRGVVWCRDSEGKENSLVPIGTAGK